MVILKSIREIGKEKSWVFLNDSNVANGIKTDYLMKVLNNHLHACEMKIEIDPTKGCEDG